MQQVIFIILLGVVAYFATKGFLRIRRNILLGKDEIINDQKSIRLNNVLLIAFGQKKMFKRFIPAIFHFFIYAAFFLTQIELIEIIIDGIIGTHRIFAPFLGGFYTFLLNFIEFLSLLAFIATVVFLSRRNLIRLPRFKSSDLNGWPRLDANLILLGEILLIVGIFCMNGADGLLQQLMPEHYHSTGKLVLSSQFAHTFFGGLSPDTLVGIERFGWWLHNLVVFGFICYLPYSKHLHIFLSFLNVYYSKLTPRGQMENMPEIMNEVKSMLGIGEASTSTDVPEFGANDVMSLSWKNVMDAYSCTECGRCSSVCPANLTGKKLSPRKIMMDVRDRANEIGNYLDKNKSKIVDFNDGKSLFNYISPEEIHACTTCNACVEACPVLINPLDIIFQLRRYEILTLSQGPTDWLPMFNALENTGAVWQMPVDRENWRQTI